MPSLLTSNPPHRFRAVRYGFTLIELLMVIVILAVLLGILLPVVGKVREQAKAADTRASIGQISAAIQAYYGDFSSFPGPIPNAQLRQPGNSAATPNAGCGILTAYTTKTPAAVALPGWTATTPATMSMAENLVLGLFGGLEQASPVTVPATFDYNASLVGTGPRSLGTAIKKFPAYMDRGNVILSAGNYTDQAGNAANDTAIPEIVDRFSDPMPLLYLRAKTGALGVASSSNVVDATTPIVQQYDLQQVISYTATAIGTGRKIRESDYKGAGNPAQYPAGPNPTPHGLQSVNPDTTIGPPPATPAALKEFYPYDLYAALIDPTIQRVTATVAAPANSPRQKDAYILISPGIDRIYGTADDITSFGSY